MGMTYKQMLEIRGLPTHMTTTEYIYVTFVKDGLKPKKVRFPVSLVNFTMNIPWLASKGLYTLEDLLSFLNKLGRCAELERYFTKYSAVYYHPSGKWMSGYPYKTLLSVSEDYEGGKNIHYEYMSLDQSDSSMISIRVQKVVDDGVPQYFKVKNNYKFTPENLEFLSEEGIRGNEMFFGMEVEMATDLPLDEIQRVVTQVEPVQRPFFYFKHDGSIDVIDEVMEMDGWQNIELVTLPCNVRYLRKNFRVLFEKLKKLDYQHRFDWNSSCGIHLHLSSNAFFEGLHKKKFVTFFNQYERSGKALVQKLGKRRFTTYCKNNVGSEGVSLARRLQKGVYSSGYNNDKYSACRETDQTVEVRIFKSGFEYEHITYCIEAMQAMFDYCRKVPLRTIGSPYVSSDFTSWLFSQPKYKTLKKEFT